MFSYLLSASILVLAVNGLTESPKGFKYLGKWERPGPDGNIIKSEYHFSDGLATWGNALSNCRQTNLGHLVAIETPEEDLLIHDLLLAQSITTSWTSGMPLDEVSSWIWASTGNVATYFNWKPGQPTSQQGTYAISVGGIFTNYGWYSTLKQLNYRYVCELDDGKL